MKKFLTFSFCVAAAVFFTACSKESLDDSSNSGLATISISSETTKAALSNGSSVVFNSGDEICIYGSSSHTFTASSTGSTVDFTGDLTGDAATTLYAIYPSEAYESNVSDGQFNVTIPAKQVGVKDGFDPDAAVMVGCSSSKSFMMKNVVALVKLTLTTTDITSISLFNAAGVNVAGTMDVTIPENGTPTIGSASVQNVQLVPSGDTFEAGTYYIAVAPAALTGGIELKFTRSSDVAIATKIGTSALTFYRSEVMNLGTVDSNLTWSENTIESFARKYVTILDIWSKTTGTINMLDSENIPTEGDHVQYNVENAHYVPSTTTITVNDKTYSTADMLETALRCYLLIRGYDGTNTTKSGAGNIPTLTPSGRMSTTGIPSTHSLKWGTSPYNETSGNGGHLVMGSDANGTHCQVKINWLDNFAFRNVNYPIVSNKNVISNLSGYINRKEITGYYGCASSMRGLITYAFFFKYLLDNNLDDAMSISADTIFRTEEFGDEGGKGGEL